MIYTVSKGLSISFIVIASIVFLYFFSIFVCFLFAASFKKKLHKKKQGLNLIVVQRYDMLLLLKKNLEENNCAISDSINEYLKEAVSKDPISLNKYERKEVLSKLSKAYSGLMYIADFNSEVKNSATFQEYRKSLVELDEIYRQNVAKYNSDIAGYNYWVSIFIFRWFFKSIKFIKKDIIV